MLYSCIDPMDMSGAVLVFSDVMRSLNRLGDIGPVRVVAGIVISLVVSVVV